MLRTVKAALREWKYISPLFFFLPLNPALYKALLIIQQRFSIFSERHPKPGMVCDSLRGKKKKIKIPKLKKTYIILPHYLRPPQHHPSPPPILIWVVTQGCQPLSSRKQGPKLLHGPQNFTLDFGTFSRHKKESMFINRVRECEDAKETIFSTSEYPSYNFFKHNRKKKLVLSFWQKSISV